MSTFPLKMKLSYEVKDEMKIATLIISLILCGVATGSGITMHYNIRHTTTPINTSLFLAAVPASTHSSEDVRAQESGILATHTQQLLDVQGELQESKDDRRLIHDEIGKAAITENEHYNTIKNRLDVSDARTATIGWIFGILFTVTQSVLLFFHIDQKFDLRKQKQNGQPNTIL